MVLETALWQLLIGLREAISKATGLGIMNFISNHFSCQPLKMYHLMYLEIHVPLFFLCYLQIMKITDKCLQKIHQKECQLLFFLFTQDF